MSNRVMMKVLNVFEGGFHRFDYSARTRKKLQVGAFKFPEPRRLNLRGQALSVTNKNGEFFKRKFDSKQKLAKLAARKRGDDVLACLNKNLLSKK